MPKEIEIDLQLDPGMKKVLASRKVSREEIYTWFKKYGLSVGSLL